MLFFACCLSLGIGFLSAVSHLLLAVDQAIATRARELLAGDLQVVSNRPFTPSEKKTLSRVVTGDRQSTLSVSLASMLTPASSAPFLVSVKAVEAAYPLHGKMQTQPSGAAIEPGYCFLERTAAIAHHLKIGDTIRLGRLELRIKAILDKEPDRDFFGFTFAPRLMISLNDLSRAGLLGFGARVRYSWTMALADRENPDTAVRAAKKIIEKSLPDPHLSVTAYMDGEASIRDGLRRSGLFFTLLSLSALLLGAAGLRAGVALFLNKESESIGLLRCLGLTRADIEKLYGGLCLSFGLLGGAMGATGG
jgi:putative ABC transport system permease protein